MVSEDGLRLGTQKRAFHPAALPREGGAWTASLWLSYSLLIPVRRGMMDGAAPADAVAEEENQGGESRKWPRKNKIEDARPIIKGLSYVETESCQSLTHNAPWPPYSLYRLR